ncbi:MAG TPA: C40 family peptidase [Miltoncostaeaceae bacterium]|nr:C40 family peptidase [Miltoncostaeaceae bacterium]
MAVGLAVVAWGLVSQSGPPPPAASASPAPASDPAGAARLAEAPPASPEAPAASWARLAPAQRRTAVRAYLRGPGRFRSPGVSVDGVLVQAALLSKADGALARRSPDELARLAADLTEPGTLFDARARLLGRGLVGRRAQEVSDAIGDPDLRLGAGRRQVWYYDTGPAQWKIVVVGGRMRSIADVTSSSNSGAALGGWLGPNSSAASAVTVHPALPTSRVEAVTLLPAGPSLAGAANAADIASRWALAQIGTPYVWGGAAPGGFDCSGLVQWAYRQVGISLPRVAASQAQAGVGVSRQQLQPGDAVFFADATGYVHHVGLYIGGDRFVDAPHTGALVRVESLSDGHFAAEYAGARRFAGA